MTFTEASQLTKEQIARAFGVPAHILADPDRPAALRTWSLCMTSENHGAVGPAGCTFSHAPEKHERVQVVEIVAAGSPPAPGVDLTGLLRITIDGTVIPLATSFAPAVASTVLTDERIIDLWNDTDGVSGQSFVVTFAHALIREAAAQAGQVAVPEGWKLVPIEPDMKMVAALAFAGDEALAIGHALISQGVIEDYRAMLAAAPSPAQAAAMPASTSGESK